MFRPIHGIKSFNENVKAAISITILVIPKISHTSNLPQNDVCISKNGAIMKQHAGQWLLTTALQDEQGPHPGQQRGNPQLRWLVT